MGKVFIIGSTLLAMVVISIRNSRNNKKFFYSLLTLVKEINKIYISLFTEKSILVRLTECGFVIGAELFVIMSAWTVVNKAINTHIQLVLRLPIKIIAIMSVLLVIHYGIGYVLLITSKIHRFIYKVEDKNIRVDFILSYFIISTYFAVLIILPEQFQQSYKFGLVGVSIAYVLNLKVLVNLIKNPNRIKSIEQKENTFTRVSVAALLIVIVILLNLFLAVCLVNVATAEAFSNNPSIFDLFYYTIITFTTIGYGDIVPISVGAKMISIIISITSVVCITIFLTTILSYRESN